MIDRLVVFCSSVTLVSLSNCKVSISGGSKVAVKKLRLDGPVSDSNWSLPETVESNQLNIILSSRSRDRTTGTYLVAVAGGWSVDCC